MVDEYQDRVLVAESHDTAFYGDGTDECHLAFNFELMYPERLTAADIRENQAKRSADVPPEAWPCNTLGNHDAPRVYTRFGDSQHDQALARLSLALVLTLRGTPFLYNGEEIGMEDLLLEDIEQFRDNWGVWNYNALQEELGLSAGEALIKSAEITRDKCRTPMQWSGAANGGFSPAGVQTWLPVHPNHAAGINVADQDQDPDSLLNFYRELIAVRQRTPALWAGEYEPLQQDEVELFVFRRWLEASSCLIVLNFSSQAGILQPDASQPAAGRTLFGTDRTAGEELDLVAVSVAPFEILIAELA